MDIVQIFVYVIIIVVLVKLFDNIKNRRLYRALERFPSYPTYPLIGNVHLLLGSFDGVLAKIEHLLQPFDRLVYWLGPLPLLCLKKHDDIALVLTQSQDREDFEVMKRWLGLGIINARYEEWKKSRKMFSQAFSSDMLSKYAQVFMKNSLNLVESWKSAADTDQEADIWHSIVTANLNTILENSIGIPYRSGEKANENFSDALLEAMRDNARRLQWPLLLIDNVYMIYLKMTGKINALRELQSLPTEILKNNLKNLNNTAHHAKIDSSKTMLDLLIRNNLKEPSFTETRIRDELLHMIAAGSETTALSLSFLMLMLAINQDIQQKVYSEITQVIANDQVLTDDHLANDFTYLDQCIKETLRMYSPVIVTSRRTHKEIRLNDNTIIPANTIVVALLHFANHDPELYANPYKWDPEHFNEQAVKQRPKTAQLSFGFGPRSCIGAKYAIMSIKAQITYILLNYHLSTSIKKFTTENLKTDLSIRSKLGFPIKFSSRRQTERTEKNSL